VIPRFPAPARRLCTPAQSGVPKPDNSARPPPETPQAETERTQGRGTTLRPPRNRVQSEFRILSLKFPGRGKAEPAGRVACFAGWRLDLEAYELSSPAGERIPLTPHELQLLRAFVQRGGRVLTREAILDLVAGRDWSPEDRSVDVLVGKLRKKLESDPQSPRLIETVRGIGYKLVAPVRFD